MPERGVKGLPVRLFEGRAANGPSDKAVDCREVNAVLVTVFVTGQSPSATLTVKGSEAEGGTFLQLPDPNAVQVGVAASTQFEVVVGSAFVKVEISSISGTFGRGQGYTVIVTPYISPGQTKVDITNTASQDLAQYAGSPVGPSNPLDVQLQGTPQVELAGGVPCWAITQDSAANAAQTLTKAAVADQRHYITALEAAISGAAAGADIAIVLKDGSTAKWKSVIGNAAASGSRVQLSFPQPVEVSVNTAANLEVDAGGASVVTSASMSGYTK